MATEKSLRALVLTANRMRSIDQLRVERLYVSFVTSHKISNAGVRLVAPTVEDRLTRGSY